MEDPHPTGTVSCLRWHIPAGNRQLLGMHQFCPPCQQECGCLAESPRPSLKRTQLPASQFFKLKSCDPPFPLHRERKFSPKFFWPKFFWTPLGSWTSAPSGHGRPHRNACFSRISRAWPKFSPPDVRRDIRVDVRQISGPKTYSLGCFFVRDYRPRNPRKFKDTKKWLKSYFRAPGQSDSKVNYSKVTQKWLLRPF